MDDSNYHHCRPEKTQPMTDVYCIYAHLKNVQTFTPFQFLPDTVLKFCGAAWFRIMNRIIITKYKVDSKRVKHVRFTLRQQ